eukprot:UN21041
MIDAPRTFNKRDVTPFDHKGSRHNQANRENRKRKTSSLSKEQTGIEVNEKRVHGVKKQLGGFDQRDPSRTK